MERRGKLRYQASGGERQVGGDVRVKQEARGGEKRVAEARRVDANHAQRQSVRVGEVCVRKGRAGKACVGAARVRKI